MYFRYVRQLTAAKRSGICKGAIFGIFVGFIRLIIFVIYGVGFIYGTRLIYKENSNIGDIFVVNNLTYSSFFEFNNFYIYQVFFAIFIAVFSLAQAASSLRYQSSIHGNYACFLNMINHLLDDAICAVDSIRRLLDIVRKIVILSRKYKSVFIYDTLSSAGHTNRITTPRRIQ